MSQVWRIAFFGRLEERKGIKLFVKAVTELQKTSKAVQADLFEVYIIGPDATIDMVCLSASSCSLLVPHNVWLRNWWCTKMNTHIFLLEKLQLLAISTLFLSPPGACILCLVKRLKQVCFADDLKEMAGNHDCRLDCQDTSED